MPEEKLLWFIVSRERDNPVTLKVKGATISPYAFTDYDSAMIAVKDDTWPEGIAEQLVVKSGSCPEFLKALVLGFPNTSPNAPDVISLNSEPGDLLSGLHPLNMAGAVLIDELHGQTYWTELAPLPGVLAQSASDAILIALDLKEPD